MGRRSAAMILGGAACFAVLGLCPQTPALAADSCSGTASFDWAQQWDALFAASQAWQYPQTSACLDRSNGLGGRKLDGKLFQKDGQITFSTDSGPLRRSELRSFTITSSTAKASGQVFVRSPTAGRKFTVAQLLNEEPSVSGGGQDPIIRLEVNGGALDVVYYLRNGSSSLRRRNVLTSLNEGSGFSFEIRQYKSATRDFDIEVLIDGAVALPRQTVTGYDDDRGYFKAGCYVNIDGGPGCRTSFSRLSFQT